MPIRITLGILVMLIAPMTTLAGALSSFPLSPSPEIACDKEVCRYDLPSPDEDASPALPGWVEDENRLLQSELVITEDGHVDDLSDTFLLGDEEPIGDGPRVPLNVCLAVEWLTPGCGCKTSPGSGIFQTDPHGKYRWRTKLQCLAGITAEIDDIGTTVADYIYNAAADRELQYCERKTLCPLDCPNLRVYEPPIDEVCKCTQISFIPGDNWVFLCDPRNRFKCCCRCED